MDFDKNKPSTPQVPNLSTTALESQTVTPQFEETPVSEVPKAIEPKIPKLNKKPFLIVSVVVVLLIIASAAIFSFTQMQKPAIDKTVIKEPTATQESMNEEDIAKSRVKNPTPKEKYPELAENLVMTKVEFVEEANNFIKGDNIETITLPQELIQTSARFVDLSCLQNQVEVYDHYLSSEGVIYVMSEKWPEEKFHKLDEYLSGYYKDKELLYSRGIASYCKTEKFAFLGDRLGDSGAAQTTSIVTNISSGENIDLTNIFTPVCIPRVMGVTDNDIAYFNCWTFKGHVDNEYRFIKLDLESLMPQVLYECSIKLNFDTDKYETRCIQPNE